MWTDEQVSQLYREASAGTGGCPPAETLVRAVGGTLGREEAEAVADHLAQCADCAEDAQAVRNLEPWAGRAALEGATPGRQTREIVARRWTSQPWMGVAATLLVATTALSIGLFRVRSQERQAVSELQARLDASTQNESRLAAELERARSRAAEPQPSAPLPAALPNVAIVDLLPAGASRSAGAAPETVPAGAPLIVGVLTVPGDTPRYADYAVEVWHGETMTYRGQGFVRSAEDTFTIALPSGLLAHGANRVRLLGLRAGGARPVPIEEYALRLPNS
jgi:hypothetical protein